MPKQRRSPDDGHSPLQHGQPFNQSQNDHLFLTYAQEKAYCMFNNKVFYLNLFQNNRQNVHRYGFNKRQQKTDHVWLYFPLSLDVATIYETVKSSQLTANGTVVLLYFMITHAYFQSGSC